MKNHFLIQGAVGLLELKTEFPVQPFNTLAIICHPHPLHGGNMDHKVPTTLSKTFLDLGCGVVRFNYRGVGQSVGTFDNAVGETEDLLAVAAWAKASIPYQSLVLAGFSFGSFIAAKGAAQLNPTVLVTVAPSVVHNHFEPLLDLICPWIVLMGVQDEIVPVAAVLAWFEKRQKAQPELSKLITFENTGHYFHGQLISLHDQLKLHVQPFLI